jgi:hypothetical protein
MATPSVHPRIHARSTPAAAAPARRSRLAAALRALGAAALVAEGAVHLQQYAVIFYTVPWLGQLFVLNAAGCAAAATALLFRRTVRLGALAGAAISVAALAALAKSYAGGLFGWYEGGLRPPIEIAIAAEAIAGLALPSLLLLQAPRRRSGAAARERAAAPRVALRPRRSR